MDRRSGLGNGWTEQTVQAIDGTQDETVIKKPQQQTSFSLSDCLESAIDDSLKKGMVNEPKALEGKEEMVHQGQA